MFLVLCEETYESLLQTRKDYLNIYNVLRITKDHCASFYSFLLFRAQDFSVQEGTLLSTYVLDSDKGIKYTHTHTQTHARTLELRFKYNYVGENWTENKAVP